MLEEFCKQSSEIFNTKELITSRKKKKKRGNFGMGKESPSVGKIPRVKGREREIFSVSEGGSLLLTFVG